MTVTVLAGKEASSAACTASLLARLMPAKSAAAAAAVTPLQVIRPALIRPGRLYDSCMTGLERYRPIHVHVGSGRAPTENYICRALHIDGDRIDESCARSSGVDLARDEVLAIVLDGLRIFLNHRSGSFHIYITAVFRATTD